MKSGIVPEEGANGASRAPAVARAATVLRLLAGERSGLGVTEIARRVGLVPSTCLHVLRALVDEGFLTFDEQKKTYCTGVGLLTLVRDTLAGADFPKAVQPVLDDLAAGHHVTAVAVELDNRNRMVVVAQARANSFISLHVNVGSRFPAFTSAPGLCVAATSGLGKEALKRRFDAVRWQKPPRFEDWYADVQRARSEGVAAERNGAVRGLSIIAALLPVSIKRNVRGMALIGFEHHMTERIIRQLKDVVRDAVQGVADLLN
jgi:DNA-binding IclR family transcriptional regulator